MTVIVGAAGNGVVVMGADGVSTSWDGGDVYHPTLRKIVRKPARWGTELLLGVSGSMAHLKALQQLTFDTGSAVSRDQYPEWIGEQIWACWRSDWDRYRTLNEDTAHRHAGAQVLIGWAGQLHHLDVDGTVTQETGDYQAIGSGEDPARGAMYASGRLIPDDLEERVRLALAAAAYHRASIQAPFQVEVLPARNGS